MLIQICKLLKINFEQAFLTGMFPSSGKNKILPQFTKGEQVKYENNCPVYFLRICGKILKNLFLAKLTFYLMLEEISL